MSQAPRRINTDRSLNRPDQAAKAARVRLPERPEHPADRLQAARPAADAVRRRAIRHSRPGRLNRPAAARKKKLRSGCRLRWSWR